MAAVTSLGGTWDTNAGNKTLVGTPAVGDLIVVVAASTGATPTVVTDNQTPAGAYQKIGADFSGFSTGGVLNAWVRTALITAAASTTWTVTETSSTGGGLVVYRISGMSIVGLGAVRGSGGQSSGTLGTTPAPVLLGRVGSTFSGTQAALTGNTIITAVCNGSNPAAMTPRSSPAYTEAPTPDLGYNVPATGISVTFINSGETASTLTWGGTSATAFASIALELDTSVPQYDYVIQGRADKDRPIAFLHANHVRASFW